MNKEVIASEKAPKAIGPYSQGIRYGNLIFTSGQIPLDPATGQLVTGDIKAQTRQVMDNLIAVLAEAGTSLENVLKATCYLADMNDFAAFNEAYASYFSQKPPARSCIQAGRLPRDCGVEIDLVAFVP